MESLGGEALEVLELDMDTKNCTLWYESDVGLSDPEEAKRRAREILVLYAGPQADRKSCTSLVLNATEWRGKWQIL